MTPQVFKLGHTAPPFFKPGPTTPPFLKPGPQHPQFSNQFDAPDNYFLQLKLRLLFTGKAMMPLFTVKARVVIVLGHRVYISTFLLS